MVEHHDFSRAVSISPSMQMPGHSRHIKMVCHWYGLDNDELNFVCSSVFFHRDDTAILFQSGPSSVQSDQLEDEMNFFISKTVAGAEL